MNGYTKLFHRILVSSIWDQDDQTRIVWITMMAMADRDGLVISTVSSLSRMARVDVEATRRALEKFQQPDPDTLTSAHEGRRIEPVEGGWKLLNHAKYRELMSVEERREYYRRKRAEYRAKCKAANRGISAREIVMEKAEARDAAEKALAHNGD